MDGPRRTADIAHDLANAAMVVDAAAGQAERGGRIDPTALRQASNALYALIEELSELPS